MIGRTAKDTTRESDGWNVIASCCAGAVGGISAGLVNGSIIVSLGRMAEIAERFGAPSVGFAFFMHLLFSALMGTGFGPCCDKWTSDIRRSLIAGFVYGIAWWALAALVVMPLRLGEPLNALSVMSTWPLLVGHALFGLVLGLVYRFAKDRWLRVERR